MNTTLVPLKTTTTLVVGPKDYEKALQATTGVGARILHEHQDMGMIHAIKGQIWFSVRWFPHCMRLKESAPQALPLPLRHWTHLTDAWIDAYRALP